MFDFEKNIVKNVAFRQIVVEMLHSVFEETTNYDDIEHRLNTKPKNQQLQIIKTINSLFLNKLSEEDKKVNEYALKKFSNDRYLTLNILAYVFNNASSKQELNDYYIRIYINYLLDKYLTWEYGIFSYPIITGSKNLDAIVIQNLRKVIIKDLTGDKLPDDIVGVSIDFSSNIENNIEDIKLQINKLFNVKSETEIIEEGIISTWKNMMLLNAIRTLFTGINDKTLREIKHILQTVNKEDLADFQSGGKSNISSLLSIAIMRQTANILYKLNKIKDTNIKSITQIIAKKLMRENNVLFKYLRVNIASYIDDKLADLKKDKNWIAKLNQKMAGYGETGEKFDYDRRRKSRRKDYLSNEYD